MFGFSAFGEDSFGDFVESEIVQTGIITISMIWAKLLAHDAALAALPSSSAIGGTVVEGDHTRDDLARLQLAEILGVAVQPVITEDNPTGAGDYSFDATDGSGSRIEGTVEADGTRTVSKADGKVRP